MTGHPIGVPGAPLALERHLCRAVVIMAALNAVLRPAVDTPITPYYLLAPLIGAWLLIVAPAFRLLMVGFAVVATYAVCVGVVYGVPLPTQAAQLLKYLQLLTFLGMLSWMRRLDEGEGDRLTRLFVALVMLALGFAVIQQFTGIEIPTVVNDESSLWLNTYFFTPNDLALFLGVAQCVLLASRSPALFKIAGTAAFAALNLRNDAKAVLLATLLMIVMQVLVTLSARMRVRPVVPVVAVLTAVPIVLLTLAEVQLELGETTFDFLELFLDPFERIVSLETYDLGGSIFDRTDALIHALQSLRSMHWLGLGPGGSVHMLSLPAHELLTAKSLHNALAELAVDLGLPFLLILLALATTVLRDLLTPTPTRVQQARLMFVAAVPLLSVSQSSGYISNYAFWLGAYLLWTGAWTRIPQPTPVEASGSPRTGQVFA